MSSVNLFTMTSCIGLSDTKEAFVNQEIRRIEVLILKVVSTRGSSHY